MDKENQGLNLDRDFVANLGVPFVCPNCNELFGSQEYLNQHTDICHGMKPDFASEDPGITQSREPDVHHPDDSFTSNAVPARFSASPRTLNFHRSLISPSGLKHHHHSTIQRNEHSSHPQPYPPFPLDPHELSSSNFPPEYISIPHHSLQRNDVLLSSTTEKSHSPHLPFPFSTLPSKSPPLNGAVNGSGPVPCSGCHKVYINSWFLSHHLKYCSILSMPDIENNVFGSANDTGQLGNRGPFTCPQCMQTYVNQYFYHQHVENCPVAHQKSPLGDVPLQDLSKCNNTVCPQDPTLQQCSKDEQASTQRVTSSPSPNLSKEEVPPLVTAAEKCSYVSDSEIKPDNASGIHVCTDCGKSFTNKSNLKAHVRTHTGERPFACEECGQRFAHKSNLKKHYSVHTQEKPFDCPLCCASFAQKSGLKLHWRTHTGERPFACHECGQRFSSNSNLKKHVTIHTGEKPFACKVCGRRYSTDEALQAHVASHTGERNFVCPMCDVGFTHRGGLEAHIRTHTGEKPFSCDFCQLTFARRGGLKAHMRTHTGEKPYSCTECELSFAHKSNLNAHYRTHTGEKPFCCPHCNQKFAHKSNLKKHLMTHTDRSFTSSPASSSSDSSCPVNNVLSAPPPVISAVKKVTTVSPFSGNNCDSKFFDLLDMLEHSSTQTLLET